MNWADIVIQIIIPIGTSGILLIVLKWIAGIILCAYHFKGRRAKINKSIKMIIDIYNNDAARRGLARSGNIVAVRNDYNELREELIGQLKALIWFGNNAESQHIVNGIEIESKSINKDLDQVYYCHKLCSSIDEIKIILSNAEVLESRMHKRS